MESSGRCVSPCCGFVISLLYVCDHLGPFYEVVDGYEYRLATISRLSVSSFSPNSISFWQWNFWFFISYLRISHISWPDSPQFSHLPRSNPLLLCIHLTSWLSFFNVYPSNPVPAHTTFCWCMVHLPGAVLLKLTW